MLHITGANGGMLLNLGSALILCLLCTGRAMSGTPAHIHFALGSVDLRVVLMKLSEPEDHVLFPRLVTAKMAHSACVW